MLDGWLEKAEAGMDDRNVILLLGFFESPPNVDIHELIMIAVSMSFSLQLHVQKVE